MDLNTLSELRITARRGRSYEDGPVSPLVVNIEQADPTAWIPARLFDRPPAYVQLDGDQITFRGDNRTVTYRREAYQPGGGAYLCVLQ